MLVQFQIVARDGMKSCKERFATDSEDAFDFSWFLQGNFTHPILCWIFYRPKDHAMCDMGICAL